MIARVVPAVKEPALARELCRALTQPDVIVHALKGKTRLWERAARETCDLIIVSQSLIPQPAAETIRLLRELPDSPQVVVLSDREDPEERASFLAAGCEAVLSRELPAETLRGVINATLDRRRELAARGFAIGRAPARPRLTDFVSASPAMQAFMGVVRRVVTSDASLLILGETGVGKERLARAIHAEGPRGHGPFVAVNCGALPETLLESELFGHEEGAFTGATRSRRGMFELAHKGTIFLDEIGEMPYHLQVKLLRVLQEHEFQPVGSERPITVDVRVMAASNRDLDEEVEARRLRKDLYYRLSVITLTIPPLRERQEDIPALVESYLGYFGTRVGREVTGITDDALAALHEYSWPGNVRELINVIERAMLLCSEGKITLDELPQAITGRRTARSSRLAWVDADVVPEEWLQKPLTEVRKEVLTNLERAYLRGLLQETGGRVGETARRAGIQPRSLYEKMKHHGLRKEDFKPQRRNA